MALWVVATPLLHISHDMESHSWPTNTAPGFCEADCDTSEHKVTSLQRDCLHVRIRDYALTESGESAVFETVEATVAERPVLTRSKTVSPLPPSRAPPLI